jgi:CheY-like chemotaxis protein
MIMVSPATLRNWEERYGVVIPSRTPAGHRLYSRDQVEQLRYVKSQMEQGMSAADAHRLLARRLEAGAAGSESLPRARGRLLILVAERDEYSAELIEYLLHTEGFHVSVALDADVARHTFERARPDLTLVEFMIEGGGGERLCKWLKDTSDNPVLAVSGLDAADRALAAGADAFLQKPVRHLQLISAVKDLLGLSAILDASAQGAG